MNEETKSSDIYEHPYNDLIQEGNWYDHGTGIFELKQSRFGLWTSYDKEGKGIITALTKGGCYDGTVFHLHGVKHGFPETSTSYDGVVGGKL